MKKQNKGFTIVELVIVIAVIAILAAVLIPTFSNIIKKAQTSSDTQLIRNLNGALAIALAEDGEDKFNTANDAFNAVEEAGYNVAKIVSKSGYNIAWDKETGHFVLLDEQNETVLYPVDMNTNEVTNLTVDTKVNYFVVRTNVTSEVYTAPADYSLYCGLKFNAKTVNLNGVGFDAGNTTTITNVNYNGVSSAKDVVIRTNSLSTTLSIDAANDTITHYDLVNSVKVIRTAYASYHEKGTASYIECASGKVVVESEGKVNTVILTAVETAGDKAAVIKNNGGEVEHVYATTNDVATANNNAATEHDTLKVEVIAEGGNVLADTEANAVTIVAEKKEEAFEDGAAAAQLTCEHKFDGDTCVYCCICKKYLTEIAKEELGGFVKVSEFKYQITSKNGLGLCVKYINEKNKNKLPDNSTVELTVDIDLKDNYWEPIQHWLGNFTFDGCGHTIYNMTTSSERTGDKKVGFFSQGAGWVVKNLNFDGARVEGINHVAVIVGDGICAKIENCSVKNATVITRVYNNDDGDKAGAICGYLSAETTAWIKNCTVENVTVIGYRDIGALAGFANGASIVTGNTVKNCKVINDQVNNSNYKNYTSNDQFDANKVIGEVSSEATIDNNTTTNVTVEIKK